jgi:hypothetical protein
MPDVAVLDDLDLSTLEDDALATRLADAVAAFDAEHDAGTQDVALMESLAQRVEQLRSEQTGRTQRARLQARVHPTNGVQAATTMALRRPNLAAVASRSPQPRPPARRSTASVTITASGDRRPLDVDGLAVALHEQARMLSDGDPRTLVASIELPYGANERLDADAVANARALRSVVGLPEAAALVASGGWCAPSEPVFQLFDLTPDASGLLDLPSVSARAGAMIPEYLDYTDAAGALWTWTEADDIDAAEPDGPTKPCLRIPCPLWTEVRLQPEGLCVTHGNLSDRAWPELTRSFLRLVVGAHLHRLSAARIAKIAATATTVTPAASMLRSDAAGDLLGVIGLQAADLRSQYRLGRRRAVDVALPDWTTEMLRANVAMRAGVDLLSVSDADLVRWFTDRGIRPQFLADYQPLFDTAPATEWPDSVEFLAWIAGAYVNLDGGRIDLGVVRDSVLNATNDFTAAWSEQFYNVAQVGPAARKVSVALSIDGVTACCAAAA